MAYRDRWTTADKSPVDITVSVVHYSVVRHFLSDTLPIPSLGYLFKSLYYIPIAFLTDTFSGTLSFSRNGSNFTA